MKRLLALALAFACFLPAPADAGVFILRIRGHNIVAVSTCAGDGLAGAPSGTPQFATALTGITFRSGCAIAGVDYRVGPPEGQVFAAPSTLGANWDATKHQYRCDSTDNVTIDGIDFASAGASITLVSCTHVTIKNSKLRANWAIYTTLAGQETCSNALNMGSGSSVLTLLNDEWDGYGKPGDDNCGASTASNAETLLMNGGGPVTVDYNYIHDFDQHAISYGGLGDLTVTHSVVTRGGFQQGAHGNGSQFTGMRGFLTMKWNFFPDPQPDIAMGSKSACFGPGACQSDNAGTPGTIVLSSSQVIVITTEIQTSFRVGQHITGSRLSSEAVICAVDDRNAAHETTSTTSSPDYTTLTLGTDATCGTPKTTTGAGAGTVDVRDMYPTGLTIPIKFANDGGATVLSGGDISRNTFWGPGPIKGITYAIYCSGVTGPVALNDNWWMPADMAGLFNITTADCGPGQRSGSGNRQMDTGATTGVP